LPKPEFFERLIPPADTAKQLQGLSQAHVVGQNAAAAIEVLEPHETVEEKLHLGLK